MTTASTEAATPTSPPPPVRELGTAGDDANDWWGSLLTEKVPELRWPQAYDVYDDMMRNAQVSSVMRAVMMPILRTGWRIDGTGCKPEITQHVAADFGLPIVGEGDQPTLADVEDRFSWSEHLEVALEEKLGYGHSFFEQKAYQTPDGRWHLQKLAYRPPRTIRKINVARDGGLVSIEQSAGSYTTLSGSTPELGPKVLGVNRIVVYVHARKGSNWRGRSLLRTAYQPYLLNQRAARVEMIVVERQGAPVVVYEGAEGETDLEKGKAIATGVRAGTSAGVAIPNGATLSQKGVEGTLPDIDKIKRYNDEQIARAVLAHFLNLGTQTGSWALGSTFADFFTLSLQAVADEVARTATRHIVRDLVHWTWPGERAPRLVFDEIGSGQDALVQAIAQLVSAGVLKADESLEQFIRTTIGLPPRSGAQPQQEAS